MDIKSVSVHYFLDRLHEATRDGFLRREDVFYLIDSYRKIITVLDETVLRSAADAADLRRQVEEERMRANAAEFAVAQLRDDAADLRRQLAECRAVAQARGESLGYAEADTDWGTPPHRAGKGATR